MKKEGRQYSAALLTAAQYHGAAHQRPQAFQVCVNKQRRPLACGRVRATFLVRKRLQDVPVQQLNTPRGTLQVSTPEATAIDLIGYQKRVGGLDRVATVLSELAERLRADRLPEAARTAPISWAQRLGYLLERVGASEKTVDLQQYVRTRAHESTPLLPGVTHERSQRNKVWKLWINAHVEPEL